MKNAKSCLNCESAFTCPVSNLIRDFEQVDNEALKSVAKHCDSYSEHKIGKKRIQLISAYNLALTELVRNEPLFNAAIEPLIVECSVKTLKEVLEKYLEIDRLL